jgi:hypothetical protein
MSRAKGRHAESNHGTTSRRAPGTRLRALVVWLFDEATARHVLLPAIADLQHETAEMRAPSAAARAAIRWRAYLAFWRVLFLCLVLRGSDGERREWLRTAIAGSATLLAMTAGLIYVPASRIPAELDGSFVWLLMPQALAVSLPCSVLGAAFLAGRRRPGEGRVGAASVRPVLAYSLLMALLSLIVTVWVVPAANDAYRQRAYSVLRGRGVQTMMDPRAVPKGYAEMTIPELLDARGRTRFDPADPDSWRVQWERATYQIQLKAALPAASLAFGLAAIALAPRRRRRLATVTGVVLGLTVIFIYYAVMFWSRWFVWAMVIPAWLGAWAPPIAFSVLALLVLWRRAGEPRREAERRPADSSAT